MEHHVQSLCDLRFSLKTIDELLYTTQDQAERREHLLEKRDIEKQINAINSSIAAAGRTQQQIHNTIGHIASAAPAAPQIPAPLPSMPQQNLIPTTSQPIPAHYGTPSESVAGEAAFKAPNRPKPAVKKAPRRPRKSTKAATKRQSIRVSKRTAVSDDEKEYDEPPRKIRTRRSETTCAARKVAYPPDNPSNPDYALIVRDSSGRVVELECHVCHGNVGATYNSFGEVFRGVEGLLNHMMGGHKERWGQTSFHDRTEGMSGADWVVANCVRHELTAEDVAMLSIDTYQVNKIHSTTAKLQKLQQVLSGSYAAS